MSFGKMREIIEIYGKEIVTDAEGFTIVSNVLFTKVRGYREGRHGTERWANLAEFSETTDLFRIRKIPCMRVTVDNVLKCGEDWFEITSVEDVKGKGMYMEILAKKVEAVSG